MFCASFPQLLYVVHGIQLPTALEGDVKMRIWEGSNKGEEPQLLSLLLCQEIESFMTSIVNAYMILLLEK